MNWKHYEIWQSGTTTITHGGKEALCNFATGGITTGKQRVFHRIFIRLTLPDGTEIIGEDPHNLRTALLDLAHKLRVEGFELHAAGMDPRFYETGLSHNSGLGYIDAIGRVHMMDPITELDGSDDLDVTIREAVATIGSWAITPELK